MDASRVFFRGGVGVDLWRARLLRNILGRWVSEVPQIGGDICWLFDLVGFSCFKKISCFSWDVVYLKDLSRRACFESLDLYWLIYLDKGSDLSIQVPHHTLVQHFKPFLILFVFISKIGGRCNPCRNAFLTFNGFNHCALSICETAPNVRISRTNSKKSWPSCPSSQRRCGCCCDCCCDCRRRGGGGGCCCCGCCCAACRWPACWWPACWPACLPASWPACLSVCLPPACLPAACCLLPATTAAAAAAAAAAVLLNSWRTWVGILVFWC